MKYWRGASWCNDSSEFYQIIKSRPTRSIAIKLREFHASQEIDAPPPKELRSLSSDDGVSMIYHRPRAIRVLILTFENETNTCIKIFRIFNREG